MIPKAKYIPQLDSLRLLAMLLIFMSHCYFLKLSDETNIIFKEYFSFSGIGVEFFIILSGFFSSYTYKEESFRLYLWKKCIRLFPIHWICLFIGAYLLGIHCGKIPVSTPVSFCLLQSSFPLFASTNPPSWTISTLFIIYLVTPYIIKQFSKLDSRYYISYALCLGILSTIVNIWFYDPQNEICFWFLYVSPYFRIITFSIGVFIGLYMKNSCRDNSTKISLVGSLKELLLVCIIVIMAYLGKKAGYWYTVPLSFFILIFANGRGVISKILCNKYLVKISSISYCFYLIHFPILQYVEYWITGYNISSQMLLWISFGVSFLISFLVAAFIHYCIETRITHIKISYIE